MTFLIYMLLEIMLTVMYLCYSCVLHSGGASGQPQKNASSRQCIRKQSGRPEEAIRVIKASRSFV